MSVIRAAQVAAQDAAEDAAEDAGESVEAITETPSSPYFGLNPQYVFTITDGGFAKRTRITQYRVQSRGGIGIKAMSLANEQRGQLVGAFIVEDGDEVMSITSGGQVVRSPINADFRETGRSTMGVKFVTPKDGDSVAVVARSVETVVDDAVEDAADGDGALAGDGSPLESGDAHDVAGDDPGATIDDGSAPEED
jgi:DNA gyrase subunit A